MMDKFEMPAPESEEVDLGLEEMELPGEAEDAEISDMIKKLEELGYKVEKLDDMPEPEGDELDEMSDEELGL